MHFTDNVFLYYFLPLVLGLYYASPRGWKPWVLALSSYFFYGWWRPDFVLLMWFSTIVDYTCGLRIARDQAAPGAGTTAGKRWVVLSCCVNLGILAYFKYANFGIETLNSILVANGGTALEWSKVILPIGISFYTFQTLSYTVDVYRRDAEPVRQFRDFACYVALFPQLIAGPIVRYSSIAEQLKSRVHSWGTFSTGVMIFQAGMAKKVLLADTFSRAADQGFALADPTMLEAWAAAISYTFQIYFDFSGYSDMAIGLGLLFGFRFPVNFNRPYISRSITEFWRRWHITLSSFLRDYLYIPLGGNRKGPVRTYINLALTMLLGGLWHGAAWTYIAWGAYQGFWLVLERLSGRRTLYAMLPGVLQNALTFVIVVIGWVLFRASSIPEALQFLGAMAGRGSSAASTLFIEWSHLQTIAYIAGPLVIFGFATTQEHAKRPRTWWVAAVFVLFLISLLHLHRASNIPFLYFQF